MKVYVSVFGDDRGKDVAIAGLKSKAKYVRSELGKRMKLRLTPEVRFIEDESMERGSRVRLLLYLSTCQATVSSFCLIFVYNKPSQETEIWRLIQVIAILDKIKAEKGSEGGPETSDSPEDDQEWGVDDPDEDIIYVK